jgi:hypothetical protein
LVAAAPWERQRLGSGSALGAAAPWERQRLGSGSALGAEAPWELKRLGSGRALEAPLFKYFKIFVLPFSVFFPHGGAVERCGNTTCTFGSRCKHHKYEGGSLKCSCDFHCDHEPVKSICGSDGNSYKSECHLELSSCHQQTHVLITDFAPCRSKFFKGDRMATF